MKISLYLETSVLGAYLDNGDAFRRDLTIRWWEHEMQDYDAFSAYLVRRELEHFPEPHRTGYLNLAKETNELDIPEEAPSSPKAISNAASSIAAFSRTPCTTPSPPSINSTTSSHGISATSPTSENKRASASSTPPPASPPQPSSPPNSSSTRSEL